MIAKRIPGIIPRPENEAFLEILYIYSAAGITSDHHEVGFHRPFRSPHHTISELDYSVAEPFRVPAKFL